MPFPTVAIRHYSLVGPSPYARRVDGKHDGRRSARPPRADLVFAAIYGVIPLVLLLASGGPIWAAVLVAVVAAGIGYYRDQPAFFAAGENLALGRAVGW